MTTPGQETLLDYTPTQDEEVARLTKLAEKQNARIEMLLADPAVEALGKNAEKVKKILKEYAGATEAYDKLTKQIRKLAKIEFNEPVENGFYILTTSELWREGTIRTEKKLFLKAFGSWWNLEDGGNSLNLGMRYGRKESFTEFFNIDDDVIEAKLVRLEDQDTFPQELLNEDSDDETTPDEVEDDEVAE